MSYIEAARTTLVEFEVYNTAYAIKQEDARFNAAIQACGITRPSKLPRAKARAFAQLTGPFNELFYDHEKRVQQDI